MSIEIKKRETLKSLQNKGLINSFEIYKESYNKLVLESEVILKDKEALIRLDIDANNKYNVVHYGIGKIINRYYDDIEDRILFALNKFNSTNVILKYFIDADDYIVAYATYIANNEVFCGDEFIDLMQQGFALLEDDLDELYGIFEVDPDRIKLHDITDMLKLLNLM